MYQSAVPIEHRISTLTIRSNQDSDYGYNRISSKYDSYHGLLYRDEHHRRRLSSTGEGSGDSSTTTSASSYSEKEDGSEWRAESEENYKENESPRAESPTDGTVDEVERQRVEMSFRGLKTQVYVSGSLANLYTKSNNHEEWAIKYTGIPVVLLDIGEARARNKRRIQIILAEKGTCFMLWQDKIDHLTSYKMSSPTFHTMYYSKDHSLQIGFSFDIESAARDMFSHIETLVSDPENISLSIPGKKKKKEKKAPKIAPLPPKSQISSPCCFQHVTNIDHDDRAKYYTLKEYVPRTAYNPKVQVGPEDL